eukprot:NODE_149_length_1981_cov_136.433230_g110_i0.p1 GENE.NODE_149_length_1981_cov_136.433230_g110_i0~~NODE_149_length_1981_cov_136.433230_g110_i0.p1  ORF type:complete len:457 (-),score=92.45 NODE_149_length_1981_cov_136.433230_g110_i0:550-1920(-)
MGCSNGVQSGAPIVPYQVTVDSPMPQRSRSKSISEVRLMSLSKARQEGNRSNQDLLDHGSTESTSTPKDANRLSVTAPPVRRKSISTGAHSFKESKQQEEMIEREVSLEEEIVQSFLKRKRDDTRLHSVGSGSNFADASCSTPGPLSSPARREPPLLRRYSQHTLLGHATRVRAVAVAADLQSYVSCGASDYDLYRRMVDKGNTVVSFTGHQAVVVSLAISPTDHMLVSAAWDRRLMLWDYQSGKLITARQTAGPITALAFAPDSSALAMGAHAGDCMVVGLHRKGFAKKGYMLIGHQGPINCLNYHPSGAYLCSASQDTTVHVWEWLLGKSKMAFHHDLPVLACNVIYPGEASQSMSGIGIPQTYLGLLVTITRTTCKVWDLQTGLPTMVVRASALSAQSSLPEACSWTCCTVVGRYRPLIVLGSSDNTVRILDSNRGRAVVDLFTAAAPLAISR